MKRTDYETLSMEEIVVEMENGFLAASAGKEIKSSDVKLDAGTHGAGSGWDDVTTTNQAGNDGWI